MRELFLGKPIHWLILAIVIAVLWWMGSNLMQTRDFHSFLLILLAITAGERINTLRVAGELAVGAKYIFPWG